MPSHNVVVCKPVMTLFYFRPVWSNKTQINIKDLSSSSFHSQTSVWLWAAALDLYAISISSLKHTECHLRGNPENRGMSLCYTFRVIITHCTLSNILLKEFNYFNLLVWHLHQTRLSAHLDFSYLCMQSGFFLFFFYSFAMFQLWY